MKNKEKKRGGFNNINDSGIIGLLVYAWKAHIVNWFWRPSLKRRIVRERVHMELLTKELDKLIPYIREIKAPEIENDAHTGDEKVFILWLQGEENAPDLIKRCIESVRSHTKGECIVLSEQNLAQYISLPSYIIEKWKSKEICPAHYADIIRIELLWQHGGYWMDATNFMISPFPEKVKEADFLMLMADGKYYPQMFVQNCFIRAKKGDPLLGMWRNLVWHYWKHNGRPKFYFLVQRLFKLLVTNNSEAAPLFDKMPKISMDPTHILWHEIGNLPFDKSKYEDMCRETFFQKCNFKPQRGSQGVNGIIPDSFADVVINKSK